MKVKIESEVIQSCLTLSNPIDCSLPGSSAHGIFQARALEWVAIALSATLPLMATLHQRGAHYYQFLNSGCIPQLTTQVEKARGLQKNIYFCFIDYAKALLDHNKLWKILKEMGIPDHLTCILRNLYAGQEEI